MRASRGKSRICRRHIERVETECLGDVESRGTSGLCLGSRVFMRIVVHAHIFSGIQAERQVFGCPPKVGYALEPGDWVSQWSWKG